MSFIRAKCRHCVALDYDFIEDRPDFRSDGHHVCGLHGCAPVDPDGDQPNFNHYGSCGFIAKSQPIQLELF